MPSLYLILHGSLRDEPGLPPNERGLSAEGRRAAMALDDVLPPFANVVVSSLWPAAVETAKAIAAARSRPTDILVDERLDEVRRPLPTSTDDADLVARYLDGEQLDGWEPVSAAARRLQTAILAVQQETIGARLLVTHPMILACWIASRLDCGPATVAARFTFPDVWRHDRSDGRIERLGPRPH